MKKWLMATAVAGFTMGCVTAQQAVKEEEPITCEAWAKSKVEGCNVDRVRYAKDFPGIFIQANCGNKKMVLGIIHKSDKTNLMEASIVALEGPECLEGNTMFRTFSLEIGP